MLCARVSAVKDTVHRDEMGKVAQYFYVHLSVIHILVDVETKMIIIIVYHFK